MDLLIRNERVVAPVASLSRSYALLLALAFGSAHGVGACADECYVGAEGCLCTDGGACDEGLLCAAGECVPVDDGTASAASAGATDTETTDSTSHSSGSAAASTGPDETTEPETSWVPTSSSTGPEETTEPETSWVPTTSSGTNEETEGAAGAGLTWRRFDRDDSLGVDLVGCGYSDGANECDPYSGDTPCSEARSVLCILKTDEPNPGVMVDGYMQWSGGHIDVTIPVQGDSFASVGEADTFCEQSFGAGWRMAEFHDGQMWYFWAYGNVPEGERFWVWINDQPSGNCW